MQVILYICIGFINILFFTKLPYLIHGFMSSHFNVGFEVSAVVWALLFFVINLIVLNINVPTKEKRSIAK